MKNQFAKIVAVLMVLAMAVSVFGLCASAAEETTESNVVLLGDVNLDGKVTVQDATLIQKAIAKLATLDEVQTAVAEVTEDGNVNVKDATMIQKWIAKYDDVNENIGKPMVSTDDEASTDEPSTPGEATPDQPSTPGEATPDQPSTPGEATPDQPSTPGEATKDEETPVAPSTKDEEATKDEPVVDETVYYLVGYINGADYGIEADWSNLGEYVFVDGTVTVELTADSYVIVKDENLTGFWTDGWLDMNPGSATLGEFGANNNKLHVPAGTATFTWDAATLTLSYTVA